MKKNAGLSSAHRLAVIGMMSAVAFISNYLSIPIGDISRIHLGNGFCLLSGILLGPVAGGFCAGIGAFFYDLTNPLYAKEAIITFFMKFVLGFTAGAISHYKDHRGNNVNLNFFAAITASIVYIIIYLGKNFISEFYFYRNPIETVMAKVTVRAGSSITNGIVAVIIVMLLAPVFQYAMKQSGLYKKIFNFKK